MNSLIVLDESISEERAQYLKLKLSSIPNLSTVIDLNDFTSIINNKNFSLVIAITNNQKFSSSEKIDAVRSICPLLVLTKVNQDSLVFIHSLIESFMKLNEINFEDDILSKSINFILSNLYDDNLSLEKVASHVYMNKYQYSKFFKKNIGIGYKDYIIKKRITKAKSLLETGVSVTETCFFIGYNDLTHFSRMFQKVVGEKPSVFRMRHLNNKKSSSNIQFNRQFEGSY
ncbi:helix-turn-helix transcriptional regulator [Sutcliffiella rhizosphaerae]|uniref:HTH araC/xylS-type domain-containing protein n=1 Tax=Sutcliffiella rhizosphaerae TaxID=2880967 RepID=A0ABM8YUS9_9BACI|nr:helix-turn-helix transcriptional regulator [Sutcliffiella rhizosphaerae]CAG9623739.1 hypothetical protein BACCIP111883_04571 [Sutcliffiella rhizosphaerae]